MQAEELRRLQKQEEHSGQTRSKQILPVLQEAHCSQRIQVIPSAGYSRAETYKQDGEYSQNGK